MTEWLENFLAVALGGAMTFFGVWWASREATLREEAGRLKLLEAEREVRLKEFQHSNFLDLQEALLTTARLTVQANYEDNLHVRQGGAWKSNAVTEPLNSDLATSRRRLGMLLSRVQADTLRCDLQKFVSLSANVSVAHTREAANSNRDELTELVTNLNEEIGKRVREISDS
jgi:hypothetical protein